MTPEFLSPEKQARAENAWKLLCEGKLTEIDESDLIAFLARRFVERANAGDVNLPPMDTTAE